MFGGNKRVIKCIRRKRSWRQEIPHRAAFFFFFSVKGGESRDWSGRKEKGQDVRIAGN